MLTTINPKYNNLRQLILTDRDRKWEPFIDEQGWFPLLTKIMRLVPNFSYTIYSTLRDSDKI